jgi:aspartyl-tRNA(Asn)/glutamyl-tRNA(Gln) amidotransferase subunit C
MAVPELDIRYIARLARLTLTPEEEQRLGAQLGDILAYVQKLNELEVSHVEPTAHAIPLTNVVRPDECRMSLPHPEAMRNAPSQANGLFIVPRILE